MTLSPLQPTPLSAFLSNCQLRSQLMFAATTQGRKFWKNLKNKNPDEVIKLAAAVNTALHFNDEYNLL